MPEVQRPRQSPAEKNSVDAVPHDHELMVELALSVGSAVMWWCELATEELTWMSGLGELLGLPDAEEPAVRARLAGLVAPLVLAARTAPVWQDFILEQPSRTAGGAARWLQFRARISVIGDERRLVGVVTDITGRRRQQQALTDLADRYRLLVELAPEAIVVHQDDRIVYANPAAVRFAAAGSATEILGRTITDFIHPDSVPETLRRISDLTAPGSTSGPADAVLVRFDGETVDIEAVSVRTTWEGRPAYQVIMRDITAQKAAAAALQYQAALVAHVSDALIATSADGIVTSWNPSAETVYGRSTAEAIGRPIGEVVGARLDPEDVLDAGGVAQAKHRRADGAVIEVRVSVARMPDGYVLICCDETARRRAERHFATVVAAIEEGVMVIGPTGLIQSVNPAAERILGIREQDVMGMAAVEAPLYDESGALLPTADYPSSVTRRTGQPRNGVVISARRRDGSQVWLSLSARALNPEGGLPAAAVISFTDITGRRAVEARRDYEATHDPLTGLFNRSVIIDRIDNGRPGQGRKSSAVLFIDLDKFKVINDSLGHSVGDSVLQAVGGRLARGARRRDTVGRLGGDEFAVIAHGIAGPEEAKALAVRIRAELNQPVTLDGRTLHVDASIGIVIADADDTRRGEDLLRDADLAMYRAKTEGRGRFAFFDVDLRARTQRRLQLEQDLRGAPRQTQLWLAYQPIVDLRTGATTTVEGLLRWSHPGFGQISPTEFIPIAEESDLINLIGDHMLHTAIDEIIDLRGRKHPDLQLTINLSARQLDDPRLVPAIREALDSTGLPPSALCLEITESALMRDPVAASRTLTALRELGARLAIDDFGTGYSSLAQLLTLPFDTLKIDQSFVSNLGKSKDAEAIITSIIAMAHAVDLSVVAEGVENPEQLEVLRGLRCDQVQGFHLGRPTAARDLEYLPELSLRSA
jgi:diguanylate cyclase (GGDEF)-like protein/PAS domain S-box-containing protein